MMLMGFRPDESHRCMDVKVKSKKKENESLTLNNILMVTIELGRFTIYVTIATSLCYQEPARLGLSFSLVLINTVSYILFLC